MYYFDILGEDLIEVCASIILSRASQPARRVVRPFRPQRRRRPRHLFFFSVLRKFCDGGDIVRSNVIRLRPNLQPPSPPKGGRAASEAAEAADGERRLRH